jgi:hypothetical protein
MEQFEDWLVVMEDRLTEFVGSRLANIQGDLDFSPTSLDTLEGWLLENYSDPEDLLADKEEWDGVARYVWETFRRQLGGYWDMRLDDPKYVYHGLPQLVGLRGASSPICPHTLATAAVDRRKGNYLRSILENIMGREGNDSQAA